MFGTKFWDQIASGVAEKWVDRLFSPALIFWVGGVLAYVTALGWEPLIALIQHLDTTPQVVITAGGLLVGVVGSAVAIESVQQGVLRLLEGYWPHWLYPLRQYLVKRLRKRNSIRRAAWSKLASRLDDLTPEELETYVDLEAVLANYPNEKLWLPTRLGNRLRAAEDYGWRRYGLAMGVVWPRLWGVMPESARKEIIEARRRLDTAVRFIIWSLLFIGWASWAWYWVIPLALLGIVWGYLQALEAAGVFGELLRAAFDIHRWTLYRALHWPLPNNPADEHRIGRQLTHYLWRGLDDTSPQFTQDS